MSQITAATVANHLLSIAKEESVPLTPLKLMKLVYLCEGWSLALRKDSLIREEVEAWQYGPVIPALYHVIKSYRASPVEQVGSSVESMDAEQKDLIASVYAAYKHLTGIQLSDLTHQPGTPWSQSFSKNSRNTTIPTSLIRDHFVDLAAQRA